MKDVNLLINNGVNIQKSLELFGDMQTYDDTLQDFLNDVEGKLSQIKSYKETGDMANYAILVHSLKSDSKYFGFEKLAELAYQHELESKANHLYFITEHYDELMQEAVRIVNLVRQYMGMEPSKVTVAPQNVSSTKDKTILVVDDSNIIRNFIQKIFNDTFNVLVANDGKEALDIISTTEEGKIVALLLDLNMPKIDGFSVLDYLKQNNSKIPVSIITGDGSKEAVDRAFQYPIVDVLRKPFNERDVKRIVESTMNFRG